MAAFVEQLPQTVLWIFLYFCRIGAMLMVFPGYSSTFIPVRVRLMLAIAITLALSPLLLGLPGARPAGGEPSAGALLYLAIGELLKGLALGLMARLFFLAFEFLASAVSMFIGLGNFPGAPAEGIQPQPVLVSFIMLGAVMLVFVTDLHVQALAAVLDSYAVLPIGTFGDAGGFLEALVGKLSAATFLSLQATAPFLVYAIIANLAIGLVNRLSPQIPAYFISLPLLIAGGLFLLMLALDEMFGVFIAGFADMIING